jgi:hypothetical protein
MLNGGIEDVAFGIDLFGGNSPQYQAPQYQQFNPAAFGGGMGTAYENATKQQLSGVLSPAQTQMINNQFSQNMQGVNNNAYSMPSGAAASLATNTASQNSVNQYLLGQQNVQQGQNAAMPYISMGANQNTAQNNFNMNNAENTYKSQETAYKDAQGVGLLGNAISAIMPGAMSWVGKYLLGAMGGGGTKVSSLVNSSPQWAT